MGKYKQERATPEFNGETSSNAEAALSEAGSARRSFLGRIGRRSAALAMFGLGGETWLQAFSKRSIMSSSVAGESSRMLFASNFEGDVRFGVPYGSGTSCYQDIVGTDPTTGFDWADCSVLNGSYRGHLITGNSGTNPDNIHEYHDNQILTTTGPHGNQTRAARFKIIQNTRGANQNIFGYFANQSSSPERLYWRYWLRMEPDLAAKMGPNGWISFWSWKIGTSDYRLTTQIWTNSDSVPFWMVQGDSGAGTDNYKRHFRLVNYDVPVPQGEWCKVEAFYDRNESGRIWMALNGRVVYDHIPGILGVSGKRITHGTFLTVRAEVPRTREVWLNEFEIWDNFPPDSSNSPRPPQSPGGIQVTERRRFGDTA